MNKSNSKILSKDTHTSLIVPEVSNEETDIDSEDYKHLRRVIAMSTHLQRYCIENHLPIFNRVNMHDIIIQRLT